MPADSCNSYEASISLKVGVRVELRLVGQRQLVHEPVLGLQADSVTLFSG